MFVKFLTDQATELTKVHDHATLATWHRGFAQAWGENASALAKSANATYGLTGDYAIQDDVGYLVAESAHELGPEGGPTWVLLSANPGWHPKANPTERRLKGQSPHGSVNPDTYEGYRTKYFPRWKTEVIDPNVKNGAAWWTRAIRFMCHCAGASNNEAGPANPTIRLMGWELWPMHSRRDGLSRLVKKHDELRTFAQASVAAALRVLAAEERPGGLIVASAVGLALVPALKVPNLALQKEHTIAGVRVRAGHWGGPGGVRTALIGRQLFSGWGQINRERSALLTEWCQAALAGARTAGADAPQAPADEDWAECALADEDEDLFEVLYGIATEVLGPCRCHTGDACKPNRHMFPRLSNPNHARGHVRLPGHGSDIQLNIPYHAVDAFHHDRSLLKPELLNYGPDTVGAQFKRFNIVPDIKNSHHLAFLRKWLRKSIN